MTSSERWICAFTVCATLVAAVAVVLSARGVFGRVTPSLFLAASVMFNFVVAASALLHKLVFAEQRVRWFVVAVILLWTVVLNIAGLILTAQISAAV